MAYAIGTLACGLRLRKDLEAFLRRMSEDEDHLPLMYNPRSDEAHAMRARIAYFKAKSVVGTDG
jgi:hypothetical protein